MTVLAHDFMTKICKKVGQLFHCAVSKVFDRVKSVALWSANVKKLTKDHKGYVPQLDMYHKLWNIVLTERYVLATVCRCFRNVATYKFTMGKFK